MNTERRNFIKTSTLFTAGFLASRLPLMAGPFSNKDYQKPYFPADKKLDPKWVKSLYERGEPTEYFKTKNELRYIGMPVGGICCGTVYVGGDGRLWVWDIFNENQFGAIPKTLKIELPAFDLKEINNMAGTLYIEPAQADSTPLQQGFALLIKHDKKTTIKRLHFDDWDEVIFKATYPVATIKYIDKSLDLEVTVNAFSPFIPGDAHNSGLPVTVQSVSVKNTSAKPVQVSIAGWLENKILLNTGKEKADFKRMNPSFENGHCKGVCCEIFTQNKSYNIAPDYGNMSLAVHAQNADIITDAASDDSEIAKAIKGFLKLSADSPVGIVASTHNLKAGEQQTTDFTISWFTPNTSLQEISEYSPKHVKDSEFHYYTAQFTHSTAVAEYVAKNYKDLKAETFLWRDTWYESTLPHWFLERTLLNISTLATTTSHRFQKGRFYAWEGVGCCEGTCTHVYQYAQGMSRIFPELEMGMRANVDLGSAFDEEVGMIRYRGESFGPSIDGQAGTILRIYREYLMSSDGKLLTNNWSKIKKAVSFVMKQDKNGDGMEDTPMENTLDAKWSGEIAWIVGLCIAAVAAGQKMAEDMNDAAFADVCKSYVDKGSKNMEQYLFNGEYFIHRPDPAIGKKEIGSYNTCHIDQVYGQAWAWQVGLGRILSKEKTMSALQALWKYNYMPDVGPYIKEHTGGRFYALAGDGGMVMNTNPRNEDKPFGEAKAWQMGYFNECMSGFEHQVAAHMMAEGMVEESLVLTRSIHDRYHAFKRNPFNEIECSDHYGRAMASFGTFISAIGFTYHGPKGFIGFAPRLSAENFKAPFTVAEGWGTYAQQKDSGSFAAQLSIKHGALKLKELSIEVAENFKANGVVVMMDGKKIKATILQNKIACSIEFANSILVNKNAVISIKVEA